MRRKESCSMRTRFMRSARRTFVAGSTVVVIWQFGGVPGATTERTHVPASRYHAEGNAGLPAMEFQATAYCEPGITRSGVVARPGLAAADISVLPLGTLVHVEGKRHRGVYRIMDTGRLVKGRIIDIFISDLQQAREFGRQQVLVTVIQLGPRNGRARSGRPLVTGLNWRRAG